MDKAPRGMVCRFEWLDLTDAARQIDEPGQHVQLPESLQPQP